MKTELTEEEINDLLLFAGTRARLYNKIVNIAYKKWGIILPPVNVMATMQIVEELELWREPCDYYNVPSCECFAQKGKPRVNCLGIKERCEKEGGVEE